MEMHTLVAALFFLAQPFWQVKPPERWTDREVDSLRTDSPWAQRALPAPEVVVYFATAAPIEEAESEVRLRGKILLHEPDPDYSYYLLQNRENEFVLAIAYPALKSFDPKEERKMEEESVMLIGRKSYKMVGHFPPSPSDPVLRLVFPREVRDSDKTVRFQLYLPGVEFPEREVEFRVKELMYHGKLEM
jgi:hypothetical protein